VLLLLVMGGCNGCTPKIPHGNDPPPNKNDTSDDSDSSDSVDSVPPDTDSGPPAMCDHVEVEPNDTPDEAESLEMEQWACGQFIDFLDLDWFTFTPTEPGWVTVRVEAAERGSSANPQVSVDGGGESAMVLDGYLTSDPLLVFPAEDLETWRLTLAETNLLYGEDYTWYLMASLSKAPVDWDGEEAEPNDTFSEANELAMSTPTLAAIGSAGDFDWYKIHTTEEGEQTLTINITAFKEGSVADLSAALYDEDGTTVLREKTYGEIDYDRDPWFTKKVTGVKDLYVFVRNEKETGSRFHWYTLEVTSTIE
jgi:hypothetical protein